MLATKEELIHLLKHDDFNSNSVTSFSKKYHICRNTVTIYLRENNTKYNRHNGVINMPNRDGHGRFVLGSTPNTITNTTTNTAANYIKPHQISKHQHPHIQKRKPVYEMTNDEMIKQIESGIH